MAKVLGTWSPWNGTILGILVLASAGLAYATGTAGNLDTSFDGDGVVETAFGGNEAASAAVEQADGKLVVVGRRWRNIGTVADPVGVNDWCVARYMTDGSLDPDFGDDGPGFTCPIATDETGVSYGVALDADGNILICGNQVIAVTTQSGKGKKKTTTTSFEYRVAVVRLDADGVPDSRFGSGLDGDGVVLTEIPGVSAGQWANASSIVILGNGDILVSGEGLFPQAGDGRRGKKSNAQPSRGAVLVRYDDNGDLVGNFGTHSGILVDDFTTGDDAVALHGGLGVQSDGKIVIAGRSGYLRRYDSLGILDPSFATNGTYDSAGGGTLTGLTGLAIDTSDRILVASRTGLVSRIQADGKATDWSSSVAPGGLDGVAVDSLGRIVAGGSLQTSDNDGNYVSQDAFVIRLDANDGTGDGSFGPNGDGISVFATPQTQTAGGVDSLSWRVIALANDDIVLVGGIGIEDGYLHWLAARFCGN